MKHNRSKIYIENLNTNVTEEDINELLGLKSAVYLHQNCSAEMADKNTPKSKVFSILKIAQDASVELIKLIRDGTLKQV